MKIIKGLYINLEEEKSRNLAMLSHLKTTNYDNSHERYPAVKGETFEARKRCLGKGEIGIWKTWLEILKNESEKKEVDYEFLHIIEDDARLGKWLQKAIYLIKKSKIDHDMIVTDMYINPSIYKTLESEYLEMLKRGSFKIVGKIYTGCLSSCLIHRNKLNKIYNLLNEAYSSGKKLKPLDNHIRNLMLEEKISIGVTAPFLTSVELEYISNSTIQNMFQPT